MYDPTTGSWLQQDPVRQFADPTQMGRYGYAGDDPLNRTDTCGKFAIPGWIKGIFRLAAKYSLGVDIICMTAHFESWAWRHPRQYWDYHDIPSFWTLVCWAYDCSPLSNLVSALAP